MLKQPSEPLPVRGILEAYYYLLVQRCRRCGRGPLDARGNRREFLEGTPCFRLFAACRGCGERSELLFDISQCPDEDSQDPPPTVGGHSPSRIIDVAQWLALFSAILRASSRASDRSEARRLGFEAAQCLEEAMKFYAPGEELPGEDAFLSRESYELSRRHPEQFERSRLTRYRDTLPSLGVMWAHLTHDARERSSGAPWWRRWHDRLRRR